jgi:Subtilisin inhibitor-like
MSRTRLLVCAAVAVTTALVAPAVPAVAAAAGAPGSFVALTVSDGQEIAPVRNTTALQCDPIGGEHPYAADSCSQLSAVRGDFRALNVTPQHWCPTIYQPVTVSASGHWGGEVVDFHQTYPSRCWMHARTGHVFDF